MSRQGFLYGLAALAATLADWLLFTALVLTGLVSPVAAESLGRLTGGAASFLINRRWVFAGWRDPAIGRQVLRFGALYALSFTVNLILFQLLLGPAGAWPAKLAANGACFVLNFWVMRLWVFQVPRPAGTVAPA